MLELRRLILRRLRQATCAEFSGKEQRNRASENQSKLLYIIPFISDTAIFVLKTSKGSTPTN